MSDQPRSHGTYDEHLALDANRLTFTGLNADLVFNIKMNT